MKRIIPFILPLAFFTLYFSSFHYSALADVATDPQITSVTPSEIRYGDGQDIVINGNNFSNNDGHGVELNGRGIGVGSSGDPNWTNTQIRIKHAIIQQGLYDIDKITNIKLQIYYGSENRWVYPTKDVSISLLPATPDKPRATNYGTTTITLNWTDTDGTNGGYKVYRNGVLVGSPPSSPFTDSNLSPGTYRYEVSSIMYGTREGNKSTPSDSITILPPPVAPTITTNIVTGVSSTTAIGNGDVASDGGAAVTQRGIVVSTSLNPTTSSAFNFTASGTTGSFTTSIAGLTASTMYHVRAYATNSVSTSYGADLSFTTDAPPVCSSWTYSNWSSCSGSGQQTRTAVTSSPTGCAGGSPVLNQSCTFVPVCTTSSWQCGDWNACSVDGRQVRSCSKVNNCEGGVTAPSSDQSCTYISPTCSSWTYSSWSTCSINGIQSRSVMSSSPLNCSGGSPVTSQSCTPPQPQCTEDKWECGPWNACSTDGRQTRNCTKISSCQTAQTPPPSTTQVCTPPQPPCNEDKWSCSNWSSCSISSTQTRNCYKTFSCPTASTPKPESTQICAYSGPLPSSSSTSINQINTRQKIEGSTVELICHFNGYDALGSGTVIDSNGTILTNRHVVVDETAGSPTSGCQVWVTSNERSEPIYTYNAFPKRISNTYDLALLQVQGGVQGLTPADIWSGNVDGISTADDINIYGYPPIGGTTITVTGGKISGFGGRDNSDFTCFNGSLQNYFKTDAKVDHGNSGGGAYALHDGLFIGIPSQGRNLNFCNNNPAGYVTKFSGFETINYILRADVVKNWLQSSPENDFQTNVTVSAATVASIRQIDVKSSKSAPDVAHAVVSVYNDKTKLNSKSENVANTPIFKIGGVKSVGSPLSGYFIYFGNDSKAEPSQYGAFIKNAEYKASVKNPGAYYFIFQARGKNGNISDSIVTEYRYKATVKSVANPASKKVVTPSKKVTTLKQTPKKAVALPVKSISQKKIVTPPVKAAKKK